jgi:chaperonin GroEL
MRELAKAKTAAKDITYEQDKLKKVILDTLRISSRVVGSTLGPSGRVILLERGEQLPPFATKDGITVFNSLAFQDPTYQVVLETVRDGSAKTNAEAGDSTTTCAVLSESLIRLGFEYLDKNPRLSVQKVVRELEACYNNFVIPFIKENSLKIKIDNNEDLLKKVAVVATNNDEEMASSVIEGFDIVGHGGNFTILETSGVSGFSVDKIEGFHIARGFEDSCGRFIEEFINDKGNYRTVLENPKFILYNGKLNDIAPILPLIERIHMESGDQVQLGEENRDRIKNVVLVAHQFSESVLAALAHNFKLDASTTKIIPLRTPITQQANSPYHFLVDLAAFTGAKIFDPLTMPLEYGHFKDLGLPSMRSFEYNRYKSLLIGQPEELLVVARAQELELQAKQAESTLDAELTRERMGILTGGIARIRVYGSSEAELKEKRHRVEDAVASVKSAMQYGVLPGCAKTLLALSYRIETDPQISEPVKEIMGKAFKAPFYRILENGGLSFEEIQIIKSQIMFEGSRSLAPLFRTYDALNHVFGNAIELGVLDSAAAVQMAIKNSLSVSKMLMGLSGIVVFKRDIALDLETANDYYAEQNAMVHAETKDQWESWEQPER